MTDERRTMPCADNEGVRIHYGTEGEGPPLVLQHWAAATMDNWHDFGCVAALKDDHGPGVDNAIVDEPYLG